MIFKTARFRIQVNAAMNEILKKKTLQNGNRLRDSSSSKQANNVARARNPVEAQFRLASPHSVADCADIFAEPPVSSTLSAQLTKSCLKSEANPVVLSQAAIQKQREMKLLPTPTLTVAPGYCQHGVRVVKTHVSLAKLLDGHSRLECTNTSQWNPSLPHCRQYGEVGNPLLRDKAPGARKLKADPKYRAAGFKPVARKKRRAISSHSTVAVSSIGPWSSKLDDSVTTLLATVDRKIAQDYEALAAVHRKREAGDGTSSSTRGSMKHVAYKADHPRNTSADCRTCQSTVSIESSAERQSLSNPSSSQLPDPFYTWDPERLALQLHPASSSSHTSSLVPLPCAAGSFECSEVISPRPSCGNCWPPSSHAVVRNQELVEARDLSGYTYLTSTDDIGDISHGALDDTTCSSLPDHIATTSCNIHEQEHNVTEAQLLISNLLGDSAAQLSVLAVEDVILEVAKGVNMTKRKDVAHSATSQVSVQSPTIVQKLLSSIFLLKRCESGKLSSGSVRQLQLLLDKNKALLAYSRGSLRGTNHGYILSAQTRGCNWYPSEEIKVVTDTFNFHLVPTSARDYYLWILGLNIALHYADGRYMDSSMSAVDVPWHERLQTTVPIIAKSQ